MDTFHVWDFENTQQILWKDRRLHELTMRARAVTRVFPENFEMTSVMRNTAAKIYVTGESAVSAAQRASEAFAKIGVLNFANAVSPGGQAPLGGTGREEMLCRCTNLYPCLTKPECSNYFYEYHHSKGTLYSDRLIYSENITFFKDEAGIMADSSRWFYADVISCAPPDIAAASKSDKKHLMKIYRSRIKNIFAAAEAHGVQALILGAFCCGGQKNAPETAAAAFKAELENGDYKNSFAAVIFAVDCEEDKDGRIYTVFKEILEEDSLREIRQTYDGAAIGKAGVSSKKANFFLFGAAFCMILAVIFTALFFMMITEAASRSFYTWLSALAAEIFTGISILAAWYYKQFISL